MSSVWLIVGAPACSLGRLATGEGAWVAARLSPGRPSRAEAVTPAKTAIEGGR